MKILFRVLITIVCAAMVYLLIDDSHPDILANYSIPDKDQLTEAVKNAIDNNVNGISGAELGEEVFRISFKLFNSEIIDDGKIIPDCTTTLFLKEFGNSGVKITLKTFMEKANGVSDILGTKELIVDNDWIVIDRENGTESYFALVNSLNNEEVTTLAIELLVTNEVIDSPFLGVNILQLEKSEIDATFEFSNKKRYKYLATLYKAIRS